MDASLIGYVRDAEDGHRMSGNDADDKVVVDPGLLEEAAASHALAMSRNDEVRGPLARGTRDRVAVPAGPANAAPGAGPRDLERDPAAVLRAWPHSTVRHDVPIEKPPPAQPQSRGQRRVQDKIVLAHLALDLYSEIDKLQAIVLRADARNDGEPDCENCADPRCAAKVNVMRGALLEACLLVQRVAMKPPDDRVDIEDRIHELLELLRE
jgi:hypothetical protein